MLTEHYIIEVISVEKVTHKHFGGRLVRVHMNTESQRCQMTEIRVFGLGEWEKIKKRGYFLA